MQFFDDLWIPGVSILEKIVRSILVYFFLLIALRLGGKRELGQMNGFDLVVLLILSNAVQNAIIGNDNSLLGGIVSVVTILLNNYFLVHLAYRFPKVQQIVEGKPTQLIVNGQLIVENLTSEVITEAELRTSLRRQGFEELSEVKAAILETNGSLTVERQQSASTQVNYQEIINYLNRIEAILCQTERKTSTDETDETA